jgi:hypothetical protein
MFHQKYEPWPYHGVVNIRNFRGLVLSTQKSKKLVQVCAVSGYSMWRVPFFVLYVCKKAILHSSTKKNRNFVDCHSTGKYTLIFTINKISTRKKC